VNRKNLLKLVAVAATAALCGCASVPAPQHTADVERIVARSLAPRCGRAADCTRNALAKAQREATQAASDEVVTARVPVAGAQVLKCE
jgi:hypothetical protein